MEAYFHVRGRGSFIGSLFESALSELEAFSDILGSSFLYFAGEKTADECSPVCQLYNPFWLTLSISG